jgi:hypothetical protein
VNQTIAIAAPFYMRVKRVGSQWTGSYSANGSTWTQAVTFSQAITVASIGPWAGNAGSPAPAFNALVDYFFNTASPQLPAKWSEESGPDADLKNLPRENLLVSNYPNPFNPRTVVTYAIGEVVGHGEIASKVKLSVYDVLGSEIGVLVDGLQQPGNYTVVFDGSGLGSGTYFCRLEVTGGDRAYSRTLKMVLAR